MHLLCAQLFPSEDLQKGIQQPLELSISIHPTSDCQPFAPTASLVILLSVSWLA